MRNRIGSLGHGNDRNADAKRKCLGPNCGAVFDSTWAGNRICPECKKKRDRLEGPLVEHHLTERGEPKRRTWKSNE